MKPHRNDRHRRITKERPPLGKRVEKALKEGIAYARGDLDPVATVVPVGRIYTAKDVIAIRTRRQMSQAQFAKLLAVNIKTLQSWEQGVRVPSKPTMRLLQVFDDPESFRPLLGYKLERSLPMVRETRRSLSKTKGR